MSLLAAINQSAGAINTAQIGLQVVGNNIANANTPGYIRQELIQTPGQGVRIGGLIQGTGVRPVGIRQQIDDALAARLRAATSALAAGEGLGDAHAQLESLVNELGDADLSSQLSSFNASLNDLANQPGDISLKQLVILRGQTLADHVNRLSSRASEFTNAVDGALDQYAIDINRLTSSIASLNQKIVDIEGGRTLGSDALGLRDERETALNELSTLLDITVREQETGAKQVLVGGDFLVSDGVSRDVYSAFIDADQGTGSEIRIIDTNAPLRITSGKVAAAAEVRDGVFDNFISDLNELAAGLAKSFNRVHTQGQGTVGFTTVTSTAAVDPNISLAEVGLDFTPSGGAFEIKIFGSDDRLFETHQINIDLFSTGSGTTLQDVAAQIDLIPELAASVTPQGSLQIDAVTPEVSFGFAADSSGFLAAAGINTFFSGATAADLAVNARIVESPELLAISQSGIGTDVDNLSALVDLIERPSDEFNGLSLRDRYQQIVTTIAQDATVQSSVTDGLRTFHSTLESDHLAVTSVNIDEEAIKMIFLQRAFQASSRVISTASELLEVLVNL